MRKKLYALLVGINEYPPPVPRLHGCIKDVGRIERFILDFMSDTHDVNIKRLINNDATYDRVITTFKSHLGQASSGDIVWFHYSGHGSQERTAIEFQTTVEPSGWDQTIVLYDSRLQAGQNLADKEIAVLLHLLERDAAEPPHIVVSIDACHSGSGTRELLKGSDITNRAIPSLTRHRDLESYMHGYYSDQWINTGKLNVPVVSHVVLSACESVQIAADFKTGGVFSLGLISVLRDAKGDINYSDLFLRIRSVVNEINPRQTPQFETIGRFDPFTRFLDGRPQPRSQLYEIRKFNDGWFIMCGAIHGIPIDSKIPIQVEIWSCMQEIKIVGQSTIESIGAFRSKLDGDKGRSQIYDSHHYRPGKQFYQGKIVNVQVDEQLVYVHGLKRSVKLLSNCIDTLPSIGGITLSLIDEPLAVQEQGKNSLEVIAGSDSFQIFDHSLGKNAYLTKGATVHDARKVIRRLERISNWRSILALKNQNSESSLREIIRFEIIVHDTQGRKNIYNQSPIVLHLSESNSQKILSHQSDEVLGFHLGFQPRVIIKPQNYRMYFYLFHLRTNYSVHCYEGEVVYYPENHDLDEEVIIPLWKEQNKEIRSWGLDLQENEAISYFKLIVTSGRLDYHSLEQTGLNSERNSAISSSYNNHHTLGDWIDKTIAVKLVWKDD